MLPQGSEEFFAYAKARGPLLVEMTIRLHKGDLPDGTTYGDAVAIDTETLGWSRNATAVRRSIVGRRRNADVVQIAPGQTHAPKSSVSWPIAR